MWMSILAQSQIGNLDAKETRIHGTKFYISEFLLRPAVEIGNRHDTVMASNLLRWPRTQSLTKFRPWPLRFNSSDSSSSSPIPSAPTSQCCMPLRGKLTGKVAIVTASTYGIGFAVAKKMAFDGAKVMICSRKFENVKKAVDQIRECLEFFGTGDPKKQVAGCVCHVGDREQRKNLIAKTVSKFGEQIHVLVSNAAVNPHVGPALQCPESKWDKIFDVNVKAPYFLTQELYPHFQKANGGSIIYISSIAGYLGLKEIGPYSVSKSALLGLTKVLANELASQNIRVNCVVPGVIETNFSKVMQTVAGGSIKDTRFIPMGRYGQPSEIAGLVAFLASEEASYITAENIVVAGGVPTRL